MKNSFFTPIGRQIDLAVFLGFFIVSQIGIIFAHEENNQSSESVSFNLNFFILIFNLVAFCLTLYLILKPGLRNLSQLMPPLNLSWYAAVETLKNPLTALFGVGLDNYSTIFTKVKSLSYNQSPLWQINSFSISRSTLLQIFTETGFLGITAFGFLLLQLFKKLYLIIQSNDQKIKYLICPLVFSSIYIFLVLLALPPSLIIFFLFFFTLAQISTTEISPTTENFNLINFQFKDRFLLYLISIVSFILIGASVYFLSRSYLAEVYVKKSLDGLAKNNVKQLYDNQKKAITLNPYEEKYRINFAQTNLLIADNLASKKPDQVTSQDRQAIAQAIQSAIAESKAAIALNPQKANNWENLAHIYRNILNVAQGADVWTISAYQRAIVLDPQNPNYRLSFGGLYYALGNYDEAIRLFEQTVGLKPDWANAHYNLAWALYQKGEYQRAAIAMKNSLDLVNPKVAKADYEKAQKELEEFKKKLPKTESEATSASQTNEQQLTLPSPAENKIEPKLNLPQEASPKGQ